LALHAVVEEFPPAVRGIRMAEWTKDFDLVVVEGEQVKPEDCKLKLVAIIPARGKWSI
jgi:hypothetical protein